jgi:hypothetical protein
MSNQHNGTKEERSQQPSYLLAPPPRPRTGKNVPKHETIPESLSFPRGLGRERSG